MTTPTAPSTPFANSSLAQYLDKKIDSIKGIKSEADIAEEIHHHDQKYVSRLRSGEAALPFDTVSLLAFAIGANPLHLWRLALEQRWPGLEETLAETGGAIATAVEYFYLLKPWREATNNMDQLVNEAAEEAIKRMFAAVKAEMQAG